MANVLRADDEIDQVYKSCWDFPTAHQQQQQQHQGVGQDAAPASSGPNLEGEDGAREEPIAPPPTLQLPETEGGGGGGGADAVAAVGLYNHNRPFGNIIHPCYGLKETNTEPFFSSPFPATPPGEIVRCDVLVSSAAAESPTTETVAVAAALAADNINNAGEYFSAFDPYNGDDHGLVDLSDGVGLFQGEEGLAEELEEEEIVTLLDNMAEEFQGEFGASPKDAETMRRELEEAAEEFEATQSSSSNNNTNNTDSSNNIINTNNTVSKSIINNNSGMDGISNGGAGSGGTCSSGNISSNISNGGGGSSSSYINNNSSSSSDRASDDLEEPQALLHDISPRPRQPSGHAQLPASLPPQEFNPTQLEEIKTRLLKIEEGKIKKEREEEERRKEAEEEEAAGGRRKRVRPSTASAVFRHQMAPPPENASKEEKRKYKQLMNSKKNRDKKKEEDEERKLLLKKAEVEKASKDALLCKCLGILVRHGLVGELENDSAGEGAAGPVPGGSGIRLLQVSRKVELNFERAQLEDDDSSSDDCDGEAAIGRKRKMTAEAVGCNASVGAIARKSSYRLRAKKSRPT